MGLHKILSEKSALGGLGEGVVEGVSDIHSTQPEEDLGKMGVRAREAPACMSRPDGMAGELDLIIKSDYPMRSKMKNESDPEGVLIHPVG